MTDNEGKFVEKWDKIIEDWIKRDLPYWHLFFRAEEDVFKVGLNFVFDYLINKKGLEIEALYVDTMTVGERTEATKYDVVIRWECKE